MSTPSRSLPSPINDPMLYQLYFEEIKDLTLERIREHSSYKNHNCDAVFLHSGPRGWASTISGRGIIDSHQKSEQSASIMFEAEKAGTLNEVRTKKTDGSTKPAADACPQDPESSETESEKSSTDPTPHKPEQTTAQVNPPFPTVVRTAPPPATIDPMAKVSAASPAAPPSAIATVKTPWAPSAAAVPPTVKVPITAPPAGSGSGKPPSFVGALATTAPKDIPKATPRTTTNENSGSKQTTGASTVPNPLVAAFLEVNDDGDDERPSNDDDKDEDYVEGQDGEQEEEDDTPHPTKKKQVSRSAGGNEESKLPPSLTRVEMRDAVRGTIIKIYKSPYFAAKETGFGRTKIMKACQDGGGLIGDFFFRFRNITQEEADNEELSTRGSEKESDSDVGTFSSPGSGTTTGHPPKLDSGSNRGEGPYQHIIQHALLKSPPGQKRNARKLPLASTREKVAKKQKKELPSRVPQPYVFDLSTLKPVRKKTKPSLRPRRIIELIERSTNNVVVCFRGATDACRALDMDRKMVTAACANYGMADAIHFNTFYLRYAASDDNCAAYVYGDHAEDYKKIRDLDGYATAARFRRVYEAEKATGTLGIGDPSVMYMNHSTETVNGTARTRQVKQQPPVVRAAAISQGDVIGRAAMADIRGLLDATVLCLICQDIPPNVMFDPCAHCVLCAECARVACHSFCPVCYTPIQKRAEPKVALIVRPRIFSAYSFM